MVLKRKRDQNVEISHTKTHKKPKKIETNSKNNSLKGKSKKDKQSDHHAKVFVANLSSSTTEAELAKHFEEFGDIKQVILVRDKQKKPKGFGFVVYAETSMAKKALLKTGLNIDGRDISIRSAHERQKKAKSVDVNKDGVEYCLKVRNVSEITTRQEIKEHFSSFGEVVSCICPYAADRAGTGDHSGFCFVVYKEEKAMEDALAVMHEIDGEILQVQRRVKHQPAEKVSDARVLCVTGVHFNTLHSTLLQHFSGYGEVVSVSMPKKVGRPDINRGWAMVTYADTSSAETALQYDHEIDNKICSVTVARMSKKIADKLNKTLEIKEKIKSKIIANQENNQQDSEAGSESEETDGESDCESEENDGESEENDENGELNDSNMESGESDAECSENNQSVEVDQSRPEQEAEESEDGDNNEDSDEDNESDE